ncbi:MAG: 2-oxoacid:ferredoxin oxidoreductase subunit gamma [Deltaproteobacteria bacterium]|nr:2-oxoacid:ferredoxin oxidoreductase subunit gamma [Deltaproteobacteria bacterium]
MARREIRLAGSGGQGLILAGLILAEAAGIYEGKEVAQTQSYGPEARGGASKAEVVISDAEIDYPKAVQPDILLCMNQRACDAYLADVRPGAVIIVDGSLVDALPDDAEVVSLPFTRIARDLLGREMLANIVALGALAALTGIVSLPNLEKAVLARVPKGTEELNQKALAAGVAAVWEYQAAGKPMAPGAGDRDQNPPP